MRFMGNIILMNFFFFCIFLLSTSLSLSNEPTVRSWVVVMALPYAKATRSPISFPSNFPYFLLNKFGWSRLAFFVLSLFQVFPLFLVYASIDVLFPSAISAQDLRFLNLDLVRLYLARRLHRVVWIVPSLADVFQCSALSSGCFMRPFVIVPSSGGCNDQEDEVMDLMLGGLMQQGRELFLVEILLQERSLLRALWCCWNGICLVCLDEAFFLLGFVCPFFILGSRRCISVSHGVSILICVWFWVAGLGFVRLYLFLYQSFVLCGNP